MASAIGAHAAAPARFRVSPRNVWQRTSRRLQVAGAIAGVAWIVVAFGSSDGTAVLVLLATASVVAVLLLGLFVVELARSGVEIGEALVERRRLRTTVIDWADLTGVTLVPDEGWLRVEVAGHPRTHWRVGVIAARGGRRLHLPVQADMDRATRRRMADAVAAAAETRGIRVRRDADG